MSKKKDFFKEMAELTEQWKKKYPIKKKHEKGTFDPTAVKATKQCIACGSDKDLQRHHKANDFMFARLLPDVWAADYINYRDEDCDNLCANCHKGYHIYISPLVNQFWNWYNYMFLGLGGSPTVELLTHWKVIFLSTYQLWLKEMQRICQKPSPKKKKITLNKR